MTRYLLALFTCIALIVSVTSETCPNGNTNFAIADDCNSYYDCSSGVATLKQCETGKYWDCVNRACDWWTIPACCPTDTKTNFIPDVFSDQAEMDNHPCENGYRIRSVIEPCEKYYECTNYRVVSQTCEGEEYFNNLTLQCDLTTSCIVLTTISTSTTTSTQTTPTTTVSTTTTPTTTASSSTISTQTIPTTTVSSTTTPTTTASSSTIATQTIPTTTVSSTTTPTTTASSSTYSTQTIPTTTVSTTTTPTTTASSSTTSTQTTPTTTVSTTTTPTTTITSSTVTTTTAIPSSTTSTASSTASSTQGVTVPSLVCYNDTNTYPVWSNCRQFQQDANNGRQTYTCQYGLYYNAFTKCCTTLANTFTGACGGDPRKPSSSNLVCYRAGAKLANPSTCESYFECVSSGGANVIQGKQYSSGEAFDWKTRACVHAASANVLPGCTVTDKYSGCIRSPSTVRKFTCGGWTRSFLPYWGGRFVKLCLDLQCRVLPSANF